MEQDSLLLHHPVDLYAKQKQLQLKQVQVLFRHGARTPVLHREGSCDALEGDSVIWAKEKFGRTLPHVDISFTVVDHRNNNEQLNMVENYRALPGGCLCGNLTTIGQQEAYDFGKWLANEYIVKQPFALTPRDVYVRSTLKSRTVQTAACVMAGMYGLEKFQEETLLIQSTPLAEDDILPNMIHCRRVNDRYRHHWNMTKDQQKEMNRNIGVGEDDQLYNFVQLFDIVTQRQHHGLYVPPYLVQNQTKLTELALSMLLDVLGRGSVDELRTSIGGFVNTACCRMETAISGVDRTKMILYSNHDTGIMCFLLVLGVFDGKWPPFLGNVLLELYQDAEEEGSWYVRVLCNREPVVVDEESGDEYMPVEKFLKLMENYRVADWNDSCGNVK